MQQVLAQLAGQRRRAARRTRAWRRRRGRCTVRRRRAAGHRRRRAPPGPRARPRSTAPRRGRRSAAARRAAHPGATQRHQPLDPPVADVSAAAQPGARRLRQGPTSPAACDAAPCRRARRPARRARRTRRSPSVGSCWGPSQIASSGSGWTSTMIPSAPTAAAASDSGATRSRRPGGVAGIDDHRQVACSSLSTGTAIRSSVKR